jgi:hypothetical protein
VLIRYGRACCGDITPAIHFCAERNVNEVLTQCRAQLRARQARQAGNVLRPDKEAQVNASPACPREYNRRRLPHVCCAINHRSRDHSFACFSPRAERSPARPNSRAQNSLAEHSSSVCRSRGFEIGGIGFTTRSMIAATFVCVPFSARAYGKPPDPILERSNLNKCSRGSIFLIGDGGLGAFEYRSIFFESFSFDLTTSSPGTICESRNPPTFRY